MILEIAFPGIRLELLDTQRKPVRCGIDIQNHRLHDLPFFQHLGRMLDALGPGQVGNVNQAVDALFNFDECAEIGHIADPAFHHRADAVAAVDGGPGFGSSCFKPSEMRRSLG